MPDLTQPTPRPDVAPPATAAVQFPPANRPFAIPTLEILSDAAIAACNDAIEHPQPILLSRAQLVKVVVDRFDQVYEASPRAAADRGLGQ